MTRKPNYFCALKTYITWHHRLLAVLIVAGVSVISRTAGAGDFYLRGGIGPDWTAETTFTDRNCSSTSPAALYGCGTGGDGAPYRSVGDFEAAVALEAGIGWAVTSTVRLEGVIGYRPDLTFEGRTNFLEPDRRQLVTADLSTLSGMVASYIDLPGLGLPELGPFAPFAGAGIGIVRTKISETHMTFPRTSTIVPGTHRSDVIWMATAGVATTLGERTTFDLAWRYTGLGIVKTGRGEGRVVWHDGSREPLLLDLAPTRAKLRSHGLWLSLRYAF